MATNNSLLSQVYEVVPRDLGDGFTVAEGGTITVAHARFRDHHRSVVLVANAASSTPGQKMTPANANPVLHTKDQPMLNKTVWTFVWFAMVFSGPNAALPVLQAEVAFFSNRVDWEAEASNRGFLFAEENFDGFPDGTFRPSNTADLTSFKVGEVLLRPDGRLRNGALRPLVGSAVRFGGGEEWFGPIEGPIGGIGMDLDVAEKSERQLNAWPCPFPDPLCETTDDFGFWATQGHLGAGFIGVLFDSPSQLEWFVFGSSPQTLFGADNLVVASIPVPETSALGLAATAVLTLGFLRRQGKWPSAQQA